MRFKGNREFSGNTQRGMFNSSSNIEAGTHGGGFLGVREKALRAALLQAMLHQVPDLRSRDKALDG